VSIALTGFLQNLDTAVTLLAATKFHKNPFSTSRSEYEELGRGTDLVKLISGIFQLLAVNAPNSGGGICNSFIVGLPKADSLA
jgi:hypothetical protein